MKLKPKLEFKKGYEYAWYPRWCEDTCRWVWFEWVWVEKKLARYSSGYYTHTYEYPPKETKGGNE